ncbi:hypothetical protein LCL96_09075 [Rossellomorea aquimaris]|uniref:hypothetical protein n=1 Tax=Rossellomorea aquimaris TaxID=189382 RepID=UPI001CD48F14|nr:hypothetical protein [Rossellomorea aquimaris]MCA1059087.1 hypothetical protein [Rossellomorea aquimaris]
MRQLSPIQLQQQIIHYKSEMEKYKIKCKSLENEYLSKKYFSLQKENEHLRSQIESYLQQVESKDSEKQRESSKYQALLKGQEREVQKLRYLLNQVKEQLRKYIQSHVADSKKQMEQLLELKESLEQKIVSNQIENSFLLKENDSLFKANQVLEIRLYRREILLWELETLLTEINEEAASQNQHIEMGFAEDEKVRIMNANECLKKRIYSNEIELFESDNLLTESKIYYEFVIEHQKEQLEHALIIQQDKDASIQQLQEELRRLKGDNNLYTQTLKQLRMNIKNMKDADSVLDDIESISSKDTLKKYENTIHHLQFTNAVLVEEINKLKNKPGF